MSQWRKLGKQCSDIDKTFWHSKEARDGVPTGTELVAEAQPFGNGAQRLVGLQSSLEERHFDVGLRVVVDLLLPLVAHFVELQGNHHTNHTMFNNEHSFEKTATLNTKDSLGEAGHFRGAPGSRCCFRRRCRRRPWRRPCSYPRRGWPWWSGTRSVPGRIRGRAVPAGVGRTVRRVRATLFRRTASVRPLCSRRGSVPRRPGRWDRPGIVYLSISIIR